MITKADKFPTPDHDDMVVFLMQEDNVKAMLWKFPPCPSEYFAGGIRGDYGDWVKRQEGDCLVRGFTIDFNSTELKIKSEVPVWNKARDPTVIGYIDVVVENWYRGCRSSSFNPRLFVECKPKILSFGATLRQINKYRSYLPTSDNATVIPMYLFTPDLTYKKEFESQNIIVVSPADLTEE